LILQVSNDGTRHVKLAGLHVAASSGQMLSVEPETFYYVLKGATHQWRIPDAGIASGATLHVTGVDEVNGTEVDATVVVGH
jgi:P pilus assembly chaperone PapD